MKDSTLYCILCVIVAIFCIFLGCKMVFAKTNPTTQPEPTIENNIEEADTEKIEEPKNQTTEVKNEVTSKEVVSKQDNVFYTQIRTYEGRRKGNEVRNLLETVRNCNLVTDSKILVEFAGKNRTEDVYELKSEIETGKSYDIQFEYEKDTQEIAKIIIQ